MTEPLVSVLSITYNHSAYISQAIESFLAQQTTFPFEIVIGEDCSTDGTREIVFDYAKRYSHIIRVITSDCNVGAMSNFLRTFDSCRGKYIAICEGDDFWHDPEKLQVQVDFLEANSDHGMVHSDFSLLTKDHRLIPSYFRLVGSLHRTDHPSVEDVLTYSYNLKTCTFVCRRELMAKVIAEDSESFDGRFPMGDIQLASGMIHRAPIKYIDRSLATYRRHAFSWSGSESYAAQLARLCSSEAMISHMIEKYLDGSDSSKSIRNHAKHSKIALAYWNRDRAMAMETFKSMDPVPGLVPLRSKIYYWAARLPVLDIFVRPLLTFRKWLLSGKESDSRELIR